MESLKAKNPNNSPEQLPLQTQGMTRHLPGVSVELLTKPAEEIFVSRDYKNQLIIPALATPKIDRQEV